MEITDRIKPDSLSIHTYLENLLKKSYRIPTFQRDVVWDKTNVKKLWDSICRYYPIGSILIWRTEVKLQNHRAIGGHLIADDSNSVEYQYILDGQQRTTALLTSIYGGTIEGTDNSDPSLFINLTVNDSEDDDGDSLKSKFLFWDEIDDKDGNVKQNTPRKALYDNGLIIKIKEIKEAFKDVEKTLVSIGYNDYDHPIRENLRNIKHILDNYRIPIIELRGIQVSEVCQIFERINQEGKPLNIFDIVVAKTYRPDTSTTKSFYLRGIISDFRKQTPGNFADIDDGTYLQVLAVMIRDSFPESGVLNITDRYLTKIKTEHVEAVWANAPAAFVKTFTFFDQHLHLKGPSLIPFRYFYMTLAYYFYSNNNPDYEFAKKYFWFHSFHKDDTLANTTDLRQHLTFLKNKKSNGDIAFDVFRIDKNDLRLAKYSSRGRLSRALLSLYSNQEPRDWKYLDKLVISEVYYQLTDKPNLHHVFPLAFMQKNPGVNRLDSDSLMNIVFLPQITNLEISDDNPLSYFRTYDKAGFEPVLKTHLIPEELVIWFREGSAPENAMDLFIEKRIDIIIGLLRILLSGINIEVLDTKSSV